jgi:hypothetical protein
MSDWQPNFKASGNDRKIQLVVERANNGHRGRPPNFIHSQLEHKSAIQIDREALNEPPIICYRFLKILGKK